MKYIKILWLLLIFAACTNEPKPTDTPSDTIIFQNTEMPPVGAKGMARAVVGEDISFLPNGDTVVWTTVNESYVTYEKTIRPFKGGPVPNQAPLSNAGIDKSITLPSNNVLLAGSATDADGTIKSYSWTKNSGPAGSNFNPVNAATTIVQNLTQGVHSFRLTVNDNLGLTAIDDVVIIVNAAPPPIPSTGYLSLATSGARTIMGQSNVVIENLQFKNISGNPISIGGGSFNITIRNCFFNGASEEAIEIENANNITIENCLFARVTTGVYALSASTIKIRNNQFVNVRMRLINGNEAGRGQFVQFNGVGGAGNEIINNQGENFADESNPEDLISLFNSSGTASSPIIIRGNMFRGGVSTKTKTLPNGNTIPVSSLSGGGIIAGDNGGGNVIMENNVLLTPGNYGMAIAGGTNIKILNNKIYSQRNLVSNNPLYVWAQSGASCSNNLVQGNRVTWIDKSGSVNGGWNAGNCSNTTYNPGENKAITESEMGVPAHLITFVSPAELLTIRK